MVYDIYHQEREYARTIGDPRIGSVLADSKEEAEHKSRQGQWYESPQGTVTAPTGYWAVPRSDP